MTAMGAASYPHSTLTHHIIGAFYDVYTALGAGFRETVYERALTLALRELDVHVDCQVPVAVWFRGHRVGHFRTDLIVEQTILVERKALPDLVPAHDVQVRLEDSSAVTA